MNLPEIRCPKCGAHIDLPLEWKKWIVQLYEEATGLVLLTSTAERLHTKELMKKKRKESSDDPAISNLEDAVKERKEERYKQ